MCNVFPFPRKICTTLTIISNKTLSSKCQSTGEKWWHWNKLREMFPVGHLISLKQQRSGFFLPTFPAHGINPNGSYNNAYKSLTWAFLEKNNNWPLGLELRHCLHNLRSNVCLTLRTMGLLFIFITHNYPILYSLHILVIPFSFLTLLVIWDSYIHCPIVSIIPTQTSLR